MAGRERLDRGIAARRQRQTEQRLRQGRHGGGRLRRLLDDRVRVGAAESERTDAGKPWACTAWPSLPGWRHLEWIVGPRDMPARRVEMQVWRNALVLQG